MKTTMIPTAAILDYPPLFPGSALGKAPKKILLQFTSQAFNYKGNT